MTCPRSRVGYQRCAVLEAHAVSSPDFSLLINVGTLTFGERHKITWVAPNAPGGLCFYIPFSISLNTFFIFFRLPRKERTRR